MRPALVAFPSLLAAVADSMGASDAGAETVSGMPDVAAAAWVLAAAVLTAGLHGAAQRFVLGLTRCTPPLPQFRTAATAAATAARHGPIPLTRPGRAPPRRP